MFLLLVRCTKQDANNTGKTLHTHDTKKESNGKATKAVKQTQNGGTQNHPQV